MKTWLPELVGLGLAAIVVALVASDITGATERRKTLRIKRRARREARQLAAAAALGTLVGILISGVWRPLKVSPEPGKRPRLAELEGAEADLRLWEAELAEAGPREADS